MEEIAEEMRRELEEITKGKSKFEKLLFLLDVEEVRISEGMTSKPEEEARRFEKKMRDVEKMEDLSASERSILSGKILYLNALANIQSRE